MKYLYIGMGVLVVLLAVCILCGVMVSNSTQQSSDALCRAVEAVDSGDFPTAVAFAKEAEAAWQKREHFLSSILSHEELDEITRAFSDLRSYAATQTEDEFRCRCEELILRLNHISEMDFPHFYNFMVAVLCFPS